MADIDPRKTFNVHDAMTNLSTLIDRAHAGEEIVVAKAGQPWAKIVPYMAVEPRPLPPRKPGRYKHLLKDIPDSVWFDPLPDDELDLWEGKHKTFD